MRQNKKALTGFLESETVELKLDYTDSIRKDIIALDRKSTRLNSSHAKTSRMPSSA